MCFVVCCGGESNVTAVNGDCGDCDTLKRERDCDDVDMTNRSFLITYLVWKFVYFMINCSFGFAIAYSERSWIFTPSQYFVDWPNQPMRLVFFTLRAL